jgi:hypothetical protein
LDAAPILADIKADAADALVKEHVIYRDILPGFACLAQKLDAVLS